MNSQEILDEIHVEIDDHSFHTHSQRTADDPTGVPIFPPEEGAGHNFTPFNIEYHDFHINILPPTPLELFQYFIPKSLMLSWIQYTESRVLHLLENGVIDSWNTPISDHSRITKWEGLSSSQVYIRLGILIYLGVYRENTIASHWNTPSLGVQAPLHSIIKFMPLYRFQLKTTSPRWPPYKTLQKWKECIYNALFITYAHESSARKRCCTGKEEDIGDIEIHEKHIQRDINYVWRGVKLDCLACKGFKQGQP
jgi:hypothetical protein